MGKGINQFCTVTGKVRHLNRRLVEIPELERSSFSSVVLV